MVFLFYLFRYYYTFIVKDYNLRACKDGSTPKIDAKMRKKMCKDGSDKKVINEIIK